MKRRSVFPLLVLISVASARKKYSSADFVAHVRIPVYIDSKHKIVHNKIMITDRIDYCLGYQK